MENTIKIIKCKNCIFLGNYYICPMRHMYYNDETQFIVDLTQDDSYCDIGTEKKFNEA